jgi:hypothetical protein
VGFAALPQIPTKQAYPTGSVSDGRLYSADQAFYRNDQVPTAGARHGTQGDDAQVIRVGDESRQWPIVR